MSAPVIQALDISKKYNLGVFGGKAMRRDIGRLIGRSKQQPPPAGQPRLVGDTVFWALRNISFDVSQGHILGIVGKNGAGKSTLLKLLSQITAPTTGEIRISGRTASLLEVGTGFHPELTGRENIFLNGAILGMTRMEVGRKLDEIVQFSGIEHHIDTPVKRYSSGMKVRLGFAVAAHLDPEILIIDEVLAVGDAEFQRKCLGKMKDVAGGGRTILFVSHNMSAVKNLCHSAIVLEDGLVAASGGTDEMVQFYLRNEISEAARTAEIVRDNDPQKSFCLLRAAMRKPDGSLNRLHEYVDPISLELDVRIDQPRAAHYVYVHVEDQAGNVLYVAASDDNGDLSLADIQPGHHRFSLSLPGQWLKPGEYAITVNLEEKLHGGHDRNSSILSFEVADTTTERGSRGAFRQGALMAPTLAWQHQAIPAS